MCTIVLKSGSIKLLETSRIVASQPRDCFSFYLLIQLVGTFKLYERNRFCLLSQKNKYWTLLSLIMLQLGSLRRISNDFYRLLSKDQPWSGSCTRYGVLWQTAYGRLLATVCGWKLTDKVKRSVTESDKSPSKRGFSGLCRRVDRQTDRHDMTWHDKLTVAFCKFEGTFRSPTFCPHSCIYMFCVDLRTNSHYFPTQH